MSNASIQLCMHADTDASTELLHSRNMHCWSLINLIKSLLVETFKWFVQPNEHFSAHSDSSDPWLHRAHSFLFYLSRRYYKDQNALIETFEEMRENLESNSNSESKSERRTTKMASLMSKITFAMNLVRMLVVLNHERCSVVGVTGQDRGHRNYRMYVFSPFEYHVRRIWLTASHVLGNSETAKPLPQTDMYLQKKIIHNQLTPSNSLWYGIHHQLSMMMTWRLTAWWGRDNGMDADEVCWAGTGRTVQFLFRFNSRVWINIGCG